MNKLISTVRRPWRGLCIVLLAAFGVGVGGEAFAQDDPAAMSCVSLYQQPWEIKGIGSWRRLTGPLPVIIKGDPGSTLVFRLRPEPFDTGEEQIPAATAVSWGILSDYKNPDSIVGSSTAFGEVLRYPLPSVEPSSLGYYFDPSVLDGNVTLMIGCEPPPPPVCSKFGAAWTVGRFQDQWGEPDQRLGDGTFASVVPGDTFTLKMWKPTEPGAATSASWELIALDMAGYTPGGTPPAPLAVTSGGTLGGSLTYTSTFAGILGIGFQIDAQIDGSALMIASCVPAPPTVKLTKVVEPATDGGRFNLKINGQIKNDASNGDSLTSAPIAAGNWVMVSEASGTGTNLSDYDSQLSCKDVDGTAITVSDGGFAMPTVDVECTFLNTRKGAPTVTPVPTLSEWALMLTGLLAAGLGALRLRRRA
ncbi:MAG: IPTL-CTERM sorting domain-containing protein [Burkholderiales bacterium]|nr:IPTL-CTERM sorting domain-containing protein [Burkholderiales bacterium]MBK8664977.1 IPTL-CTERM sorting domain-containing protein [Burkholderiales bacterium]